MSVVVFACSEPKTKTVIKHNFAMCNFIFILTHSLSFSLENYLILSHDKAGMDHNMIEHALITLEACTVIVLLSNMSTQVDRPL